MNEFPYLLNIVPAVVVALLSFYFFKVFFDNEEKRRRVILMESLKKDTTKMRFQAYERLIILLERMHLPKLMSRIPDKGLSKQAYALRLITTIEHEYEYNLSQQLYITKECWNIVKIAKLTLVEGIQKAALDPEINDCEKFKKLLLKNMEEDEVPTKKALEYVKGEAQKLW